MKLPLVQIIGIAIGDHLRDFSRGDAYLRRAISVDHPCGPFPLGQKRAFRIIRERLGPREGRIYIASPESDTFVVPQGET